MYIVKSDQILKWFSCNDKRKYTPEAKEVILGLGDSHARDS